ncbi:unnamed protein product [Aphanomyces euteiches]|uniref:FYVE-type domain-containing protein n=1 Tax=Aphanomyces euteiches TaxID=100861 RepID=A0A6G0XD42_9STRA|nr:hypothetical protein Ae201684_006045 [Aphanomyces euteiches]KAH9068544.1 hypothetical protein Ae201684P_004250 [Aphanomyces euteiches]KAH9156309.1 hypothetical protein AeRB84_001771 [Aphanomyces euteiches]
MSADKIISNAVNVLSKSKYTTATFGGFTGPITADFEGRSTHSATEKSAVFSDREVDGFHAQGEIAMLELLEFDTQASYHKISEKDKCTLYEHIGDNVYTVKGVATVFTHLSEAMDLLSAKDHHFSSILAKLLGPIHADNKVLFPQNEKQSQMSDDEHALLVTWLALQASSSAAVANDLSNSGNTRSKVPSVQLSITREYCYLRYSGYFTVSDSGHVERVLPNEPLSAESQAVSSWESIPNVPMNVVQNSLLLGHFVKTGFILEQTKSSTSSNAVRVNFVMSSNNVLHNARQGASEKLFIQRMVRTVLLNFSAAIMELRLLKDHLLQKHSFTDSAMCTICLKNFSFIRRKHHCRLCGDAFCATCSLSRTRNDIGDTVRVCHACIEGNPSSMMRSSDKLFALNRPNQKFRQHSSHSLGTSKSSKFVSSWSNSGRGKSPTRAKEPAPFLPNGTIHLSDPKKEQPRKKSQERKKSSPKSPGLSIPVLERKKSAPAETLPQQHSSPDVTQYYHSERQHHPPNRFSSLPDTDSRHKPKKHSTPFDPAGGEHFHVLKSPRKSPRPPPPSDPRYPPKSPRLFHQTPQVFDETHRYKSPRATDPFKSPTAFDSSRFNQSPTIMTYEENHVSNGARYAKSPKHQQPYYPAPGYANYPPPNEDLYRHNSHEKKPKQQRQPFERYDNYPPYDEPLPEPVQPLPPPPTPLNNRFDESEYIYQSTPFSYPLNFHNGNPWPDAPLTDYEDERMERARALDLLRRRDDILMYLRIATKTMGCPVATICIVGGSAGLLIAKIGGVTTDTIPRQVMLESHSIMSDEPTVVLDCMHDLRFAANPLVCEGDVGIRFYVGIPLCTSDGLILGVLSLIDTVPRDRVRRTELNSLRKVCETIMNRFEDIARTGKREQDEFQRQYELDMDID